MFISVKSIIFTIFSHYLFCKEIKGKLGKKLKTIIEKWLITLWAVHVTEYYQAMEGDVFEEYVMPGENGHM